MRSRRLLGRPDLLQRVGKHLHGLVLQLATRFANSLEIGVIGLFQSLDQGGDGRRGLRSEFFKGLCHDLQSAEIGRRFGEQLGERGNEHGWRSSALVQGADHRWQNAVTDDIGIFVARIL